MCWSTTPEETCRKARRHACRDAFSNTIRGDTKHPVSPMRRHGGERAIRRILFTIMYCPAGHVPCQDKILIPVRRPTAIPAKTGDVFGNFVATPKSLGSAKPFPFHPIARTAVTKIRNMRKRALFAAGRRFLSKIIGKKTILVAEALCEAPINKLTGLSDKSERPRSGSRLS